jgi:hypothetical protein
MKCGEFFLLTGQPPDQSEKLVHVLFEGGIGVGVV